MTGGVGRMRVRRMSTGRAVAIGAAVALAAGCGGGAHNASDVGPVVKMLSAGVLFTAAGNPDDMVIASAGTPCNV